MSVAGFSIGNESCFIGLARKGGIDVIQNEVSSRKNELLVSFHGKERFICAAANTQVIAPHLSLSLFLFLFFSLFVRTYQQHINK